MLPFWLYLVKLGGLGKPNAASNSARSLVLKFGAVLLTKLGIVVGIDNGDGLARAISLPLSRN